MLFLVAYYRSITPSSLPALRSRARSSFLRPWFLNGPTALSLAGITGIIVAIGVTVDSYLVLFERLKDEVRAGRSPRNSGPRSFASTWRTIVSADLVSISRHQFCSGWCRFGEGLALYLGLTTLCDLVVCWFFTKPATILFTRRLAVEQETSLAGGAK